jgi:quercetin dioxygenase-like cupin family protein
MIAYELEAEQIFDPKKHVEKILDTVSGGDVTVACWEPGQVSPNHCHPDCTEIYFCWQGGGIMRTPGGETLEVKPGSFVVHPPGEVHEYENGPERSLLFRVRYGSDMAPRFLEWPSNPEFEQDAQDIAYFEANSPG